METISAGNGAIAAHERAAWFETQAFQLAPHHEGKYCHWKLSSSP
jgi:hypothetical protein